MNRYRICHVSSELAPFAKTGGLADVAAGLGRYLAGAGHDVRLFLPLYRRIREGDATLTPSSAIQGVEVAFGRERHRFDVLTTPLPGSEGETPAFVYLVDCPALFDRADLYADDGDEHIRFAMLTRAAIESCQRMGWGPDVFHCNDWHTGLLPLYLRSAYGWDRLFHASRTLLTIHNIGYQGYFPARALEELDLMAQRRHLDQDDLNGGAFSFLKTGLRHADALATVSRTYAHEIQTSEYGMGMESLLRARRDVLHGIVNGVDYADWDPANDPLIDFPYTPDDLKGKAQTKEALLTDFGLSYDERVPVLGVVSRLTGQKGLELLREILPILLRRHDLRLVVLGSGEPELERYFQWLRNAYPERVGFYRGYNNQLAHRIEAGADMFLMPSRYEPCGLNQMYSLKYGTVPIVRHTGGLADTVTPFDPTTGTGTGFLFGPFEAEAFLAAVSNALTVWKLPTAWRRLMQNGMAQDFSWERQGREYEALYESMVGAGARASDAPPRR
jgi:starch synthase